MQTCLFEHNSVSFEFTYSLKEKKIMQIWWLCGQIIKIFLQLNMTYFIKYAKFVY